MQPGAWIAFGYQADEELHLGIEGTYGLDRYGNTKYGGDLLVKTFGLLLAVDTALLKGSWYTLYGGGGLGYTFNTVTFPGQSVVANSTAGYANVGLRFKLPVRHLALVIDERYTIGSVNVPAAADPASGVSFNVGGNLLSVGLLVHFFEPDDAGKPPVPK